MSLALPVRAAFLLLALHLPFGTLAGQDSEVVSADDRLLAVERLNAWIDQFGRSGLGKELSSDLRQQLVRASWSVDPEMLLTLDARMRADGGWGDPSHRLGALLAAERWEAIEGCEVLDPSQAGAERMLPFWIDVARQARNAGDLARIDWALAQVDRFEDDPEAFFRAIDPNTREGLVSLGRTRGRIAATRALILIARLETLRRSMPIGEPMSDVQAFDLERTTERLHQAAGDVPSFPIVGLIPMNAIRLQLLDYATLESWRPEEVSKASASSVSPDTEPKRPLRQAPWGSVWSRVPDFDQPIVQAWVTRRIATNETDAVFAYLQAGKGPAAAEAKILARLAGADSVDATTAKAALERCESLVASFGSSWGDAEFDAVTSLAFAYRHRGDLAGRLLALRRLIDGQESTNDSRRDSVLFDLMHDLPDEIRRQTSYAATYERLLTELRGRIESERVEFVWDHVRHSVPLRSAAELSAMRAAGYHAEYHRLIEIADWTGAAGFVARNFPLNNAWRSSYPTLGAESTRRIGLPATLAWAAEIDDQEARALIELGAIAERFRRATEPAILYYEGWRPDAIVPDFMWPTDGC